MGTTIADAFPKFEWDEDVQTEYVTPDRHGLQPPKPRRKAGAASADAAAKKGVTPALPGGRFLVKEGFKLSTFVTCKWKEAAMIEVAAFALAVSVAFVLIGKTMPHHHHHHPRSWKRIDDASRVHYMRRSRLG